MDSGDVLCSPGDLHLGKRDVPDDGERFEDVWLVGQRELLDVSGFRFDDHPAVGGRIASFGGVLAAAESPVCHAVELEGLRSACRGLEEDVHFLVGDPG